MKNALLATLVVLIFLSCTKQQYPANYTTETTEVGETYSGDAAIQELINPYKEGLDAQMNEVIGTFGQDMFKKKPEGELGNFMSDAVIREYNLNAADPADWSMQNYGGIRMQNIPAGEVTMGTMFQLMPFENEAVILELSGDKLKALIERMGRVKGYPVSSEFFMRQNDQQVAEVVINGTPIDYSQTYRIIISDYVANGGDGMDMLRDIPQERTGIKIRDYLIAYTKRMTSEGQIIEHPVSGRIVIN